MQTPFILLVLVFISSNLMAQSSMEELDYIQSIFGMEKKAMVAEVVKPSADQEAAFWKLYDSYETARKALGKERIELILKYGDNYENLNNALADDLLKQSLALTKRNDKLVATYVKKIRKATNSTVAMQFHQFEMYILSEVRIAIAGSLPFPEAKE